MTTIELEKSAIERNPGNPYAVSPYSDEILALTAQLVQTKLPFMSANRYPDMNGLDGSDYKVYVLDSEDGASDIARAIEGEVMHTEWTKSFEDIQEESRAVENNTLFVLIVDASDAKNPKPAASLSIADCKYGPSETHQIFVEQYGDMVVPSELRLGKHEEETGLWDIMAVMALPEYRAQSGKLASSWAYSALYELSQLAGVERWISTMTVEEERMICDKIGIPFRKIDGTSQYTVARDGKTSKVFGFQTINVSEIRPEVSKQISLLEEQALKGRRISALLAMAARISLNGSLSSDQRAEIAA